MYKMQNVTLMNYLNNSPEIESDVLLASGSAVIGDVKIGKSSSIWFNTVLRGDVHYITVGEFGYNSCQFRWMRLNLKIHAVHVRTARDRVQVSLDKYKWPCLECRAT